MKFVIKCLSGQIDVYDAAVSARTADDVKVDIFQKSGIAAQTCLFFEDSYLADGSNLSDYVIGLCEGMDTNGKESSAVSKVEDAAVLSGEVAISDRDSSCLSSSQDRVEFPAPQGIADTTAIRRNLDSEPEGPLWKVIGGATEGGVLVRQGFSLISTMIGERLSSGAHIQQLELRGHRLKFRRLSGAGPQTGWISIQISGKILAERVVTLPSQPKLVCQTQKELLPIALIFPCEGTQHMGMVKSVHRNAVVRDMFEKARVILGYDLLDLIMLGPETRLSQTRFAQPAIFVASLTALEKLKTQRPEAAARASAMAGVGLGHYTALCAAGVLSFEDGLRIVKARAEAMEQALSLKRQLLIMVLGLNEITLRQLCIQAARLEGPGAFCQIAHFNCPQGYAVGGTERAALLFKDMARDAGALVARIINVTVASETLLMKPALHKLSAALEEALPQMESPRCKVWETVTAQPMGPECSPEDFVSNLKKHLTYPLLWELSVRKMLSAGITEFYEVGPKIGSDN